MRPASEIENRVARAVGAQLAIWASAIDDRQINHGVLGGDQAIPQPEQTHRLQRSKPTETDVRNAIERATVSATRIEILLTDLPMLWPEQWRDLGLQEPVQAGAELGRSIPLSSARR